MSGLASAHASAIQAGQVAGVALEYGALSRDMGGWVERFAPGAFASQLPGFQGVSIRFQHVAPFVLGTTAAGTATITSDRSALRYTVNVPRSLPFVLELVERGDLAAASIGFFAIETSWTIENGLNVRTVEQAQLTEISLVEVGRAAYPQTTAALRSIEAPPKLRAVASGPQEPGYRREIVPLLLELHERRARWWDEEDLS